MKYIHYGHKCFDRSLFRPVKNTMDIFKKPKGGFWASAIDAEFGWKDWCDDQNFRKCDEENSFRFKLKDGAKVLHINKEDMELPCITREDPTSHHLFIFPDWEQMVKDGWDAVEVHISECRALYEHLYGWDCDSILVLNPDVVEAI